MPLFAVALLAAPAARATTIDTFSFSQSGYTFPGGSGGVLTGSFTGSVEADGYIELADLTNIQVQFQYGPITLFGYGPASFFSFSTTGGGSTLDLETSIGLNSFACVGAVAAFSYQHCDHAGAVGSVSGGAFTVQQAVVTLVSSEVVPPPPVPLPAPNLPVDEPATAAILGGALIALGVTRRQGTLRR